LMYGLFASWSGHIYHKADIPKVYGDASDRTGVILEQLSSEIVALAKAIDARSSGALDLSGVLSVYDWLKLSYGSVIADDRTVASCLRSGPLYALQAPMLQRGPDELVPDFGYRFLSEDVPYGLVIVRAIAELAGVDTPTIDSVLRWTERMLEKSYFHQGMVQGTDTVELPTPQNHGIHSLSKLIDWYGSKSASARDLTLITQ
jgi:hypothetical protein